MLKVKSFHGRNLKNDTKDSGIRVNKQMGKKKYDHYFMIKNKIKTLQARGVGIESQD